MGFAAVLAGCAVFGLANGVAALRPPPPELAAMFPPMRPELAVAGYSFAYAAAAAVAAPALWRRAGWARWAVAVWALVAWGGYAVLALSTRDPTLPLWREVGPVALWAAPFAAAVWYAWRGGPTPA
jgi:hypothetical protein